MNRTLITLALTAPMCLVGCASTPQSAQAPGSMCTTTYASNNAVTYVTAANSAALTTAPAKNHVIMAAPASDRSFGPLILGAGDMVGSAAYAYHMQQNADGVYATVDPNGQ